MKIEIVGGAAAPRVSVMDRVAASGQRTRVPVKYVMLLVSGRVSFLLLTRLAHALR